MTFLTIVGVTEILCSFRLVLEGKTSKEIPESSRLEFLEKFSANNFALSDAEDNISGSLDRGGVANISFVESTISSSSKVPFVFLAHASLAASRTFFATNNSLSEL